MAEDARVLALSALEYFKKVSKSDIALDKALRDKQGVQRDFALASRIFYGVLQNIRFCDFYIETYSSVKISKMQNTVLDALRIGAYQLLFLDRVPERAAVNECVGLCRKRGLERACGLVNAVLRRIAENAGKLEIPGYGTAQYLEIKYSHPLWLVEEYNKIFGFDDTKKILEANNSMPPQTLQINTQATTAQRVAGDFSSRGTEFKWHSWLDNCIEVSAAGDLTDTSEFKNGSFFIQDAASRLAVKSAGLNPGMRVLDICAAPGGKSYAAAIDMNNNGEIISCDLNDKKINKIAEGAHRMGLGIIKARNMDARAPDSAYIGKFDAVICDAPCSGLGVIRKKPEIRYKRPDEFERLPELQLGILEGAASCVIPGGVLIYSTCTTRRAENTGVISRFLENNSEFFPENPLCVRSPILAENGVIELWPHLHGTDGFFICRMRRKK